MPTLFSSTAVTTFNDMNEIITRDPNSQRTIWNTNFVNRILQIDGVHSCGISGNKIQVQTSEDNVEMVKNTLQLIAPCLNDNNLVVEKHARFIPNGIPQINNQ